MADADEQQITLPDAKMLRCFGGAEVFDRDAVARLEPWLSAQSGDVEKHAATDDSVSDHLNRERGRAGRSDDVDRHVVVELRVVDDMAQRVDVARGVPMDVHREAVHREVESSRDVVIAVRASHARGVRVRGRPRPVRSRSAGRVTRSARAGLPSAAATSCADVM